MNEKLQQKLNALNSEWLTKKLELEKESNELKKFLNDLVGSTLFYKNREYKITKIFWDDSCNFLGGSIEITLQKCNPLVKFLCTTVKYIHFNDFYNEINKGNFKIKIAKNFLENKFTLE
jgi:hypothetical protein